MTTPIYLAANPVDAQIVLDYLDAQGIACRIQGNFSWGALGDLPQAEAYPRLYLEHEADRPRALDLIRAYERGTGLAPHGCSQCGESSPGNFTLCWNCGRNIPSPLEGRGPG